MEQLGGKVNKQCKINHGIMPFWIDSTREKCEEIGFEVMEERDYICECGNEIKQYEEGDDTMELCEECK